MDNRLFLIQMRPSEFSEIIHTVGVYDKEHLNEIIETIYIERPDWSVCATPLVTNDIDRLNDLFEKY